MICLESSRFCPLLSIGSNLPLYIEVGLVHGGLGSLIYGLRVPESKRSLQWCEWTLVLLWSQRSPGRRPAALF
jgi:hypothetical protein